MITIALTPEQLNKKKQFCIAIVHCFFFSLKMNYKFGIAAIFFEQRRDSTETLPSVMLGLGAVQKRNGNRAQNGTSSTDSKQREAAATNQ